MDTKATEFLYSLFSQCAANRLYSSSTNPLVQLLYLQSPKLPSSFFMQHEVGQNMQSWHTLMSPHDFFSCTSHNTLPLFLSGWYIYNIYMYVHTHYIKPCPITTTTLTLQRVNFFEDPRPERKKLKYWETLICFILIGISKNKRKIRNHCL